MSVFFVQGKGWRYNFILNKKRYSKGFFRTKRKASQEEAKRKETILNSSPEPEVQMSIIEKKNRHGLLGACE